MPIKLEVEQMRGAVAAAQEPPVLDREWRSAAACVGVDPELFFPVAESGPVYEAQVATAKAVCLGCRVRDECLMWALDALPDGIAGGMTPQERRQEKTRRRDVRRDARRLPVCPVGATRAEVAAVGRAAIAAGGAPAVVAREFGVTERTAQRWATEASSHTTSGTTTSGATTSGTTTSGTTTSDTTTSGITTNGKQRCAPAATSAHLQISQQHDAQAGTRAAEGHRS